VDVYVGPEWLDLDRVVEVNRAGTLKPGDGAPPGFRRVIGITVVVTGTESDGVRLSGGVGERFALLEVGRSAGAQRRTAAGVLR
jgi:hypothetical protein